MSKVFALETQASERPEPQIVSAFTLLKDFQPIESIVDGLPLPRGGVVSLTAPTGHGKTTVTTLLEVSLVRGIPFAGREVTQGCVLVLAGENPDDFTMHLAATAQDKGLYGADLSRNPPMGQLLVIPGTFDIDFELDVIAKKLHGQDLVAVIVDTSAAFYSADDENANVDMRRHASALRRLSTLPGKPCVIVNCHPPKNAQRDSLMPRGGGAFLAEVDANLTLWKDETGIVTLSWCGKIRGSSFEPVRFELQPVELDGIKDRRGKAIFSVAARAMHEERAEQLEEKAADDQDLLLVAMVRRPSASIRDLAMQCGWVFEGKPQHNRVDRRMRSLEADGLVAQDRKRRWQLTPKGKREAEALP